MGAILNIMCPAVFDFMPMTLILYFHNKNFQPRKQTAIDTEEDHMDFDEGGRLNTTSRQRLSTRARDEIYET